MQTARYVLQGLTVLVTLCYWRAHARQQPYPQTAQNALESCLFFSTALVLVLGIVYTALLRSLIDVDDADWQSAWKQGSGGFTGGDVGREQHLR